MPLNSRPVVLSSHDTYPKTLRWLHWTIAFLMIALLIVGFLMTNVLPNSIRYSLYGVHKSFGIVVWCLGLVRIMLRLTADNVPPHPASVAWYEHIAARIVYGIFYILMLAFPLSGYVMSSMGGHPVTLFGIPIPTFLPENKALAAVAKDSHTVFGYALTAFIVLHVAGALKHYIMDDENLFKRMWRTKP